MLTRENASASSASSTKAFTAAQRAFLAKEKYLRVRAGTTHRFTGMWGVVVDGRLFVRSWTLRPDGWNATFRRDPAGAILVDGREVAVRAKRTRGEKLLARIDEAYRAKYTTKANQPYVAGLCEGERRASTTELVRAR